MNSKALLQEIIRVAKSIQHEVGCFSNYHAQSAIKTGTSNHQHLVIPSSSHLIPDLIEAGVPIAIAETLSERYHASAKELAEYQSNTIYMNVLTKIPPHPYAGFVTEFQEAQRQTYHKALLRWREKILDSVRKRFGQSYGPTNENSRPKSFDQKFVPFLEKCFGKNQRPSREDKKLLAQKTGMSYRQIHVWFQNRRSRTKKSSWKSDSQHEEFTCYSRASSVTLVEVDPFSGYITPSYAFPMIYPPKIEEDPFPCRFGDFSSFAKPRWRRSPSTTEPPSPEPDVSALISAFEKLQIDDDSESKTMRGNRSTSSASKSVTKFRYEMIRPTVIRPLRAPLTALVRTEITCSSQSYYTSSQGSDLGKRSESTSQTGEYLKAKSRKPGQRKAVEQGRSKGDQQSLPPTEPTNEQQFVTSAVPAQTKRARKKAMRSKPATRKGRKTSAEAEVAVKDVREPEDPPSSHPSPTTSIESLPSLSYSTSSSSSSTYSVSPPSSFAMLSNDGLMSSPFDEYRSSSLALTLPPSLTFDDHPPPPATFISDGFSFDLPKGPLDYPFDFGLSRHPSYSDSIDSLAQGLGSPSDLMFPSSFELPCLVP
ncbi:hypothetical protein ACEPAH_988 [Sanghuangporus vaninii]